MNIFHKPLILWEIFWIYDDSEIRKWGYWKLDLFSYKSILSPVCLMIPAQTTLISTPVLLPLGHFWLAIPYLIPCVVMSSYGGLDLHPSVFNQAISHDSYVIPRSAIPVFHTIECLIEFVDLGSVWLGSVTHPREMVCCLQGQSTQRAASTQASGRGIWLECSYEILKHRVPYWRHKCEIELGMVISYSSHQKGDLNISV